MEGLAQLKPVFRPDGTVTAGNACPLNDGAAAVVVMSDTKAAELGIRPLARIISSGLSALNPEIMGLGPIEASRQALARAGMTIEDVDLVEINEAFAAQVIPSARHLGIDADKLNVHGGAIALGHPFGMTGARIMTTLIHGLQAEDKTIGLETMCVGGGQGMAMIIERLLVGFASQPAVANVTLSPEREASARMHTTLGSSVDGIARTTYCWPPLVSAASDQALPRSGSPVPRPSSASTSRPADSASACHRCTSPDAAPGPRSDRDRRGAVRRW